MVPIGITAVTMLLVADVFNVDTFYALYTGRVVAASGPPHTEVLTAAAAHSWIDQQWLSQWVFFQADRLAGLAGVALLCWAATSLAGTIVARLAARRGGSLPVVWAMIGVTAVGFITVARTQTLVYPLFALLLWLLTDVYRQERWHPKALLAVPVLAVWANMHGSVLLAAIGTVACFAAVALRQFRRGYSVDAAASLAVGVVSAASVFATPYGVSVLHYYVSLMDNAALRTYVSDWNRTSFSVALFPFLVLCILSLGALVVGVFRRRQPHMIAEVLAASAVTGLAFYSGRYVVWAALLLPYVASVHGDLALPRPSTKLATIARSAGATLLVVLLCALASTPDHAFTRRLPLKLSVEAAKVAQGGAVVLADESTSTALLWRHPEVSKAIAFDIRYEQYRQPELRGYFEFLAAANPSFACHYGALAISTTERPKLVRTLRSDPTWTATYDGPEGIVAVRTPGTACP